MCRVCVFERDAFGETVRKHDDTASYLTDAPAVGLVDVR